MSFSFSSTDLNSQLLDMFFNGIHNHHLSFLCTRQLHKTSYAFQNIVYLSHKWLPLPAPPCCLCLHIQYCTAYTVVTSNVYTVLSCGSVFRADNGNVFANATRRCHFVDSSSVNPQPFVNRRLLAPAGVTFPFAIFRLTG